MKTAHENPTINKGLDCKFQVLVTVHHERKEREPTRCNQSDVYYQTSISTCFGHHYAHHQNKTVYYCIWCSALVVLAVIVWSCVVSCVQ